MHLLVSSIAPSYHPRVSGVYAVRAYAEGGRGGRDGKREVDVGG